MVINIYEKITSIGIITINNSNNMYFGYLKNNPEICSQSKTEEDVIRKIFMYYFKLNKN